VKLQRLAIFGAGLIGGSFAAALKQAGAVEHVVGVGRSRANLERALELQVIDTIAIEPRSAVRDAELVLIAVPVQQTEQVLSEIAPHVSASCVITDAGSTKQDVVAAARRALGSSLIRRFVPGHPIAGAERSGVEAASAALYRDRLVVLTPTPDTDGAAIACVRSAWGLCGARLVEMDAKRHDEVFAAVSHLPHALAFALVQMYAARPHAEELVGFAGAGFRDFTRIAGSSPEMWRDICIANRDALLAELDAYLSALQALRHHLAAGDAEALERIFQDARAARSRWLSGPSSD
jgi:prephenate dehydrogenase